MDLTHIGYCGVDCAACPDYLSGKCPDCHRAACVRMKALKGGSPWIGFRS